MYTIKDDQDFWIIKLEEYILMLHRVKRPDSGYAEFCVGELAPNSDGTWEVRVAKSYRKETDPHSQRIVATCDSQKEAIELLWEQRKLMHWGVYQ